jgi:hypothetical protein
MGASRPSHASASLTLSSPSEKSAARETNGKYVAAPSSAAKAKPRTAPRTESHAENATESAPRAAGRGSVVR